MKVGLDIMGGDYAPIAPFEGALLARKELPADVTLTLIGDENNINSLLKEKGVDAFSQNIEIVHAPEVITMNDHPTKAIKQKPLSTISVGFHLLREGKIDAFASTGNTGAMLVGAMYSVKSIPGVIRPCITSVLPRQDGSYGIILDVGANADCKPDVLYQFAVIGSLYAKHVCNISNPKIGLLNIGEEEEKGNLVTQSAYVMMKDSKDFNFIGNVEGRDIFDEKVDVVVCDGFTGNVVLKEAEAFYSIIKKRGLSDDYFDRFNYENYGGTPILGVNAPVIIGHGISSGVAIKNMLLLAREVKIANLSERIKSAFQ